MEKHTLVTRSPEQLARRQEIIDTLKVDNTKGQACHVLVQLAEADVLVAWHGGYAPSDVVDYHVFQEFFPVNDLVKWQNDILCSAPRVCGLKQYAGRPTLKQTYACTYYEDAPWNDAILEALAKRFN